MVDDEAWADWSEQIAQAKSFPDLRRRLLSRAEQLGMQLLRLKREHREQSPHGRPRRLDEWRLLGIEVRASAMESAGASKFRDDQKLVLVREADPPQRQRFTVAHEIGHFFLKQSELASGRVSHSQEETLCDEFASKLLLPPRELAAALRAIGEHPSGSDILALCKHFGVGLQPMLIALNEHLGDDAPVFLAASYRGHKLRPDVMDFRVDASAHPKALYVANDQRLSSIGLAEVAHWAKKNLTAARGSGATSSLKLKLWDRERRQSGVMTGSGHWDALRLSGGNVLLVSVVPTDVSLVWAAIRKSSSRSEE